MNRTYFTFDNSYELCHALHPEGIYLSLIKNNYNDICNDSFASLRYGYVKINRSILNKGYKYN